VRCPRLVISGTSSNSGKTFVTMGLARALQRRGFKVKCFKSGPDYIDAEYLSRASGRPSGNLDTWMMAPEHIMRSVGEAALDSDIVLIEGVRSLYDGASPLGDEGSTAHLAKVLSAPVVLVMNIQSLARGAAASALGFMEYDRDVDVSGFIINMVKGPRHHIKATSAIWQRTGKRIYGSIRRDRELSVTMRHLGLITVAENEDSEKAIDAAADTVEGAVDVDALFELACNAPDLDVEVEENAFEKEGFMISVAHDKAFTFIYHENLRALRALGARIEYISPLSDRRLPDDTSALLLLGGYPECHSERLGGNKDFIRHMKTLIDDGMPVYAECGGMMYLGRELTDLDGRRWKMAGVLDIDSRMHRTSQSISYSEIEAIRSNIVARQGDVIRGHEFHYSSVESLSDDIRYAFDVKRGRGIDGKHDGIMESNVLAQYSHIHMASQGKVAMAICDSAKEYLRK